MVYSRRFLLTRPSRDVTAGHWVITASTKFLLTRPSRDVTGTDEDVVQSLEFLLTRPSRDVTIPIVNIWPWEKISTHTSLAGRDRNCPAEYPGLRHFYSHVPRGT